jgi:hypothetical protein
MNHKGKFQMNLIKSTKVLLLLPLIVFSLFINDAFSEEFDPHDINDVTYVSFGAGTLNIGELNKTLSANKYLPFSSNDYTWGTGTRNINGKIMMGSEGNFTLGGANSALKANGYKSYLTSSFNMILNVGYV